jgi:hyaluronan synthase
MFIFLVTFVDFLYGNWKLFFVFYLLSLAVLIIKLYMSRKYRPTAPNLGPRPTYSVIIPVFNEPLQSFVQCLASVRKAAPNAQIIVVENGLGATLPKYKQIAKDHKAEHLVQGAASKRLALALGAHHATGDVLVLLDSDTIVEPDAIKKLMRHFADPEVGGVVPRQRIAPGTNPLIDRIADWYEDLRFGNTTPGLSYMGQVPCLIGRLYAVRKGILMASLDEFVDQRVLGIRMETGDDRVITNYALKMGYKTVYDRTALVWTFAPSSVYGFMKQRLRWSRSSFRETVLALPWLWRYPYAMFVMWSDIILRWMFLAVIVLWALGFGTHILEFTLLEYVAYGALGFIASAWVKQWPHLVRHPEDFWIAPFFLLWNTVILTPVEWYGNLTCLKQGWLTRK